MEKEKVVEQLNIFKEQMTKLDSLLKNSSSVLSTSSQQSYKETIAQIKALVQSLEEKLNSQNT
jgi:hypothetical protein